MIPFTKHHHDWLLNLWLQFFRPIPRESVSEWACRDYRFDEPKNNGPFVLRGREFWREPLDSFKDRTITDLVIVSGSQLGKTSLLMAGVAWKIKHDPSRALWVMPARELARTFSATRWMPSIEASPAFQGLVPTGKRRHDWSLLNQKIAGSILGFVGSNSPGQLASNPVQLAIKDETDKFNEGTSKEAGASNLVDQRTKKAANPKRVSTSTPTLDTGVIWQELLKGDCRRYFVPCPHCSQFIVFAWGREFLALPALGSEAFICWDRSAKRTDGSWDFDKAKASAHAVCPHCKSKILDGQKEDMIARGEWRATKDGGKGFRSYHIPSIYGCDPETSFGNLVVKFLKSKESLEGLQGFVNGDLGEPWQNQDSAADRTEIIVTGGTLGKDAVKVLSVDVQRKAPFFWYTVIEWLPSGDARVIEAGHCDEWFDVRAKQEALGIQDNCVLVDCGDRLEEVLGKSLLYGKIDPRKFKDCLYPRWNGWLPIRGMGSEFLNLRGIKSVYNWDFHKWNRNGQNISVPVLCFANKPCKDTLFRLRNKKTKTTFEVSQAAATAEFWMHMDVETLQVTKNGRVFWAPPPYSKKPNHLYDCVVMQIAFAYMRGWLKGHRDYTSSAVVQTIANNEPAR